MRDPDGYLIEVGQMTMTDGEPRDAGLLRVKLRVKRVPWIVALVAVGAVPSLAQEAPTQKPDDLQKQLEQLKREYDATTHDLEQRIAALEQQIQKQKEASEKAKEGTISAVELAAQ
jgi:hypothetical protein